MSTSPFVTLKKVWVSSALGLLLLGSLTACAESLRPSRPLIIQVVQLNPPTTTPMMALPTPI